MSQLKTYTTSKLKELHPELKSRIPCLWTRDYYVDTFGHVSQEKMKEFIIKQKNK